jgi:hypothetical protein
MSELVERYARGDALAAPVARAIEHHAERSADARRALDAAVRELHGERLARVFDGVVAEIAAPPRSRLERMLIAVRCPEPTARVVAATPVLRWAWAIAVLVVLLFAAGAAGNDWRDADRIVFLLALAPLVPVVGVAAAYGASADRAYEVATAAPLSGLRLLLLRTAAVLGGSVAVTLLVALLTPAGGWLRLAWIVPSIATTACTLALATRLDMRRAAQLVTLAWLVAVIVVAQATDDAVAAFRVPAQLGAAAFAAAAVVAVCAGRRRLDRIGR